jgi:hypothetical protein
LKKQKQRGHNHLTKTNMETTVATAMTMLLMTAITAMEGGAV